jgi:N-acylneuraminate cytidylyltransferase/CMP-N,N'-diacetyllegionaminic acid synthase
MLAIIPARGGSKGLPGKNLRNLCGLPLICHTIRAALKSNLINKVIISTEDNEIASVAKDCGADVPFMRPHILASDKSMAIDTYLHAVDYISKKSSKQIESFVVLLPTSPLKTSKDIDEAIKIFNHKNAESVISVVEASIPLFWNKYISVEGTLENYVPEFNTIDNRQGLDTTYIPNGAVYVFRTEVLRSKRQYYTKKTYPYIMPKERSVDIDDLIDFEWAEYLLNKNIK